MKFSDFKHIQSKCDNVLDKKMFFISGVPKSGTTWLQKALDGHPEISCSGEGHFFNTFGDLLRQSVNIYNDRLLASVTREVYEGNPYYEKMQDEDLDFLITCFVGLMMNKRGMKEETIFVGDKTPSNALHMDIIHRVFPEAKFIHIYRDGRDVVVSSFKHGLRNDDKPKAFCDHIEPIAQRWVDWNKAALEFGRKKGVFFSVCYEDLIEDFPKHFSNILRFLGADDAENLVNHCAESSSFEKLSGGRKRGEENSNSFYRKGISGDWKNHFSEKDLYLFNKIGGDMLRELKYEAEPKVLKMPAESGIVFESSHF